MAIIKPAKTHADLIRKTEEVVSTKNKLISQKTTVGTSETRILFPSEGTEFEIYNPNVTDVWLGNKGTVAVSGSTSLPIIQQMRIPIIIKAGDEPDIYGIVSSGTVDIFVFGVLKG